MTTVPVKAGQIRSRTSTLPWEDNPRTRNVLVVAVDADGFGHVVELPEIIAVPVAELGDVVVAPVAPTE